MLHQDTLKAINERVLKLKDASDLDPKEIALTVIELSSLWANVNRELVDADCNYRERKKIEKEKYKTTAEALIFAEASPEYRQYKEAEARAKSLQEIIRSGKRYIRLMENESKESAY